MTNLTRRSHNCHGAAIMRTLALRGVITTKVGGHCEHEDTVTWPVLVAERAHTGVLSLALAAGLSPNIRNCDFFAMPLLCTAIFYCKFECARVLLEKAGGEALLINAMFPIMGRGGLEFGCTVKGAGLDDRDLLVLKSLQPVYARDATAMDCALGHNMMGKVTPEWLLEMLRARGGKTGAQLGGRAKYYVRGGAGQ